MCQSHLADDEGTAYHEAGHAVMGAIRNRPPLAVSIVPNGRGVAGQTIFPNDCPLEFKNYLSASPGKRDYVETRILIEVAGTIYVVTEGKWFHKLERRPGRDLPPATRLPLVFSASPVRPADA